MYGRAGRGAPGAPAVFDDGELALYARVIARIKRAVEAEFALGAGALHFTAPTFITRTLGGGERGWAPTEPHDEYWHVHVDKNNTAHYDYSGLLYLATLSDDFDGGVLQFAPPGRDAPEALETDPTGELTGVVEDTPEEPAALEVAPARGRLMVFSAGRENPHRVTKVTRGARFVLSFWFTCDASRHYETFLDGRVRYTYGQGDEL